MDTNAIKEAWRRRVPRPRTRLAAQLYGGAVAPTIRAAAQAAGISPATLYQLRWAKNSMIAQDHEVAMRTVRETIDDLTRRALRRMAELIESNNEHVAARVCTDVLDRNPETSRTIKTAVAQFHLTAQEAKEIAAALVEGSRCYAELASRGTPNGNDRAAEPGRSAEA